MRTGKTGAPLDLNAWGQLLKRDILSSMNCHALGTIVDFDETAQKATVSLNYKRVVNGQVKDYTPLAECPVVILGGGSGHLTFPITAGDTCLIFFNDVNMNAWVSSGNTGTIPEDTRLHSFSDAIALVGLHAFPQAVADYSTDKVRLYLGSTQLRLGAKIHLANTSTDLYTVLNSLQTALTTFATACAGSVTDPVLASAATALGTALGTITTLLGELLE